MLTGKDIRFRGLLPRELQDVKVVSLGAYFDAKVAAFRLELVGQEGAIPDWHFDPNTEHRSPLRHHLGRGHRCRTVERQQR